MCSLWKDITNLQVTSLLTNELPQRSDLKLHLSHKNALKKSWIQKMILITTQNKLIVPCTIPHLPWKVHKNRVLVRVFQLSCSQTINWRINFPTGINQFISISISLNKEMNHFLPWEM